MGLRLALGATRSGIVAMNKSFAGAMKTFDKSRPWIASKTSTPLRAAGGQIASLREYFDPTRAAKALDTPILGLES